MNAIQRAPSAPCSIEIGADGSVSIIVNGNRLAVISGAGASVGGCAALPVGANPEPIVGRIGATTATGPTLADVRKAWASDMRRRGCKPQSVATFLRAAELCAGHCGWKTVADVSLPGALDFLGARRADGWSGTTHDGACSALRCFGDYIRKAGHCSANVLQDIEPSGEQGEDGSRALTLDEARAMIATAHERETRDRRAKGHRALFYAFLCLTGLRAAEAAACKWKDIDLDGDVPQITTDAKWSKNGRRMRVCLNREIAGLLRAHRTAMRGAPADPVFPIIPNRPTWHQTRERAGVAAVDARGRGATQHSCRKFLATILDATGASAGVVARILRHSNGITQQRYVDPPANEERAAVERIPALWPGHAGKAGAP